MNNDAYQAFQNLIKRVRNSPEFSSRIADDKVLGVGNQTEDDAINLESLDSLVNYAAYHLKLVCEEHLKKKRVLMYNREHGIHVPQLALELAGLITLREDVFNGRFLWLKWQVPLAYAEPTLEGLTMYEKLPKIRNPY